MHPAVLTTIDILAGLAAFFALVVGDVLIGYARWRRSPAGQAQQQREELARLRRTLQTGVVVRHHWDLRKLALIFGSGLLGAVWVIARLLRM